MLKKIKESVEFIQKKINGNLEIGIVLGSGLGGLVKEIIIETEISYSEIPNFPISTVDGHKGALIIGKLGGKKVIAMQGRFHYYEGYEVSQTVFPIRVMKYLGIKYLFLSNAAGGMNPNFKVGDLMIISDHINLIPNPLIGKNHTELGPRFPDLSEAYSKELREKAKEVAKSLNIKVHEGVYVATTGPTFETPAEYKYFHIIGGDTVGMSTAPEVIIANHMGLPCFAMSVVTDMAVSGIVIPVSHEEVLKAANLAEEKMTKIFIKLIESL